MKKFPFFPFPKRYDFYFPFLSWLPELKNTAVLRADLIAGLSVVMLLIPQSMAYAQLAGLPAYYGLYAAFIPPIIAALFGSSRILSTGPVAITSLLTATTLQPLITNGSETYLLYVVLLTLMAGIIQLALGVLRLGIVINFVSYPVLIGFTNAAALIIATAQLGSLLGIPAQSFSRHYQTVWHVLTEATTHIHVPTVALAGVAFVSILICRKFWPKAPRILIAVVITTFLSWVLGYENSRMINADEIVNYPVRELISTHQKYPQEFAALNQKIESTQKQLQESFKEEGATAETTTTAMNKLNQAKWQLERRIILQNLISSQLNEIRLHRITTGERSAYIVPEQITPIGEVASKPWRITDIHDDGRLTIQAGGKVVGYIPSGLPAFKPPVFEWNIIRNLFLPALVIALIGFMEATTISRYLAAETRELLNVNQELVGQGLAKIAGSFFQSMPVSGAFSRTVVNYKAGAKTGFSSIFAGFMVMIVLLMLTSLFYYLPLATLAVVIMMAALGLLNFKSFMNIYKVSRREGLVAVATFILTLILAPKLEYAILLGMLMALGIYLNESRRPRFTELTRNGSGDIVEAKEKDETCYLISLVRFGGSLFFANAPYLEKKIIKLMARKPKLRYIILDCVSINKIDASGLDVLTNLCKRLEEAGVELWLTRLRQPVMKVLIDGGLYEELGEHNFHSSNEAALAILSDYLGAKHMSTCPLGKKA